MNLFAELVAYLHFSLVQHFSRSAHKHASKRVLQLLISANLQVCHWVRHFVGDGYG